MTFSSLKKRFLGHGENVASPETIPAKKQRRTGPVHGERHSSQREELNKLLSNEEDSLESQQQKNHPTAKQHPVSCSFAATQYVDYKFF